MSCDKRGPSCFECNPPKLEPRIIVDGRLYRIKRLDGMAYRYVRRPNGALRYWRTRKSAEKYLKENP